MENTQREVVLRTEYKREKGYLYPTSSDENGNLIVLKIKAGRKKA